MDTELSQRKFGVELEFIRGGALVNRTDVAQAIVNAGIPAQASIYTHAVQQHWKIVDDGSLTTGGSEIVSPILQGDDGIDQIAKVCNAIDAAGGRVNRSCGLHVHVGVSDYGLDDFKQLLATYAEYEPVIDTFMARSRRANNNTYARATQVTPQMKAARDLAHLRTAYGNARYRKVNLESYWKYGTVEFRQHQGTLNASKATSWVLFCLRMVAQAKQRVDVPRIRILSHHNPRRYGTDAYRKFGLYQNGMTRADALAAGLNNSDIKHDLEKGHIRMTEAEVFQKNLTGLMRLIKAPQTEEEFFRNRALQLGSIEESEI